MKNQTCGASKGYMLHLDVFADLHEKKNNFSPVKNCFSYPKTESQQYVSIAGGSRFDFSSSHIIYIFKCLYLEKNVIFH